MQQMLRMIGIIFARRYCTIVNGIAAHDANHSHVPLMERRIRNISESDCLLKFRLLRAFHVLETIRASNGGVFNGEFAFLLTLNRLLFP